ncbi:MAG: hypothetical protein KKC55_16750 [Gammaproteobacteria bacterium]|uniref:Uncharacterized protein n=1 Tax=viral metagenome TaxID=1070528 RepID=A0A6M3MD48_9ZZZZ|nr:hypothetical protein [Gammaproteobacteria bacterium]
MVDKTDFKDGRIINGSVVEPSRDLMTDNGFGESRRLRVDVGDTDFFAGRKFRDYIPLAVPVAGPSIKFRFSSPINFILWAQDLDLTQGALDLRVYTGSTTSGTWVDRVPIGINRMTDRPQPYYEPQCRLALGGGFTGGTEVDMMLLRASAANNSASNVGDKFSERGLPPGIYYGELKTLTGGVAVSDAAQGKYNLEWAERPPFV